MKKNPESLAEMRKFEVSEVMEAVRREVTEYVGLDPLLTMEELDLLYVTCNFDLAWRAAGAGPWCALFTPHQLQVSQGDLQTEAGLLHVRLGGVAIHSGQDETHFHNIF